MDQQPRTPRIFDCFNFFKELDLLEIRLGELYEQVDCFTICESRVTHSGKPKPLYYLENKERFKQWEGKIFHYIISQDDWELEDEAYNSPRVTDNNYLRDYYQKESVKKALIAAGVQDEDVCFVSDADEIPRIQPIQSGVWNLVQSMYAYWLNNRSSERWTAPFVGRWKDIKNKTFNELRNNTGKFIENGGWHFTNMGDAQYLKEKIEAYSAQEFNTPLITNLLQFRINQNIDYLGRGFTFTEDYHLPAYLLEHKDRYAKYFRNYPVL